MTRRYIIAHDVGTGGDKAILADVRGRVITSSYQPYDVTFPSHGAAEQDPDMLWLAVVHTTRDLLSSSGIDPRDIIGIGISAQAFNLLPVDEKGQPVMNMIGWMDLRCSRQAEHLLKTVDTDLLYQGTGNLPRAKDVIPKILWLKEERPDLWKRTHLLINCKEYIIHKLTGKYAMDWHSASIFFLFDSKNKTWSRQACEALGIPHQMLPQTFPSSTRIGDVTNAAAQEIGLKEGTPVILCPADIAAAQLGCGAAKDQYASLSLGTGGWVCVSSNHFHNSAEQPFWALGHIDPEMWIIGAGMDTAGGGLVWLRQVLFHERAQQGGGSGADLYQFINQAAASIAPGPCGLFFIPWIYGERGHMGLDHYLRGAFIGLDMEHGRGMMARAVMEGTAYQFRWMIESLEEVGLTIHELKLIGGGSSSPVWLQIISDVTGRKLHVVQQPQEVGCVGTALTTAIGLGIYPDSQAVEEFTVPSDTVRPGEDKRISLYETHYQEYRNLCQELMDIYNRLYRLGIGNPKD